MNGTDEKRRYAGHFVSAPWRSSGKSMVSMGLARAATRRSTLVQTFKKGPDYIDPLWLKAASHNPCYNLDPFIQNDAELHRTFNANINQLVLVEGTMGLHDGLAVDGSDSNAAIANCLNMPVLLVVDCRGMHRTIASLVNGIVQFNPDVAFTGLILNRIRSSRHASKIECALTEYCDVDVIGVVAENDQLHIDERELGLVPAPDHAIANQFIDTVADVLESSCDIDRLLLPNLSSTTVSADSQFSAAAIHDLSHISIAIARDEAFHFYYEDDLKELRSRGVQLIEFSPLRDTLPADIDGLLIGGGFPERHVAALSENLACRAAIARAVEDGLPVRAECGGLMYLCQSIEVSNVVWPMVDVIKGAVSMQTRPQGRGYMKLAHKNGPIASAQVSDILPAHEFHHSTIAFDTEPEYAFRVSRGHGIDGKHDGVCVHNVIASYAHFRHTESTPWIDWFLDTVQRSKQDSLRTINHV